MEIKTNNSIRKCYYDFEIEISKDNYKIIKVQKNHKNVYLGSKYNMSMEIEKFLKNIDGDENSVFIIFGVAMGEHIKKLRETYKDNTIIVIEPNIKLVEYLNFHEEKFLKQNKIILLPFDKCIRENLTNNISVFRLAHVRYFKFSNYDQIYEEEYCILTKVLGEVLINMTVNLNTNKYYSVQWFNNCLQNLKYITNGIPYKVYKNKFKNIPAVIVSAGPSLDRNIKDLKYINKNMLLFTGARTLKALLDNGTSPDLLALVDPEDMNYDFLKGYIEEFVKPMLIYEGANSKAIKEHKGEKIFFSQNKIIDKMFEEEIGSLIIGGSVSHTLIYFAALMGCNPIILVGQDLAYTGEKVYSDVANSEITCTYKNDKDFYVEDINGGMVRVSREFNLFRISIEEDIIPLFPNTKFIDATEGGAKIRGTEIMTLKEAINKYEDNNKIEFNHDEYTNLKARENCIKLLKDTENTVETIVVNCKKCLELNEKMKKAFLCGHNNYDKIIHKLEKEDKKIENKCKKLGLLSTLFYDTIYEIMSDVEFKVKKDESREESVEKVYKKSKNMYNSIIEISEFAIPQIKETIYEIENI